MRGIIKLPVSQGKQELTWYMGRSRVAGTTTTNPVVQLRINRDADFVCRRLWAVMWPGWGGTAAAFAGTLPAQSSVILRDGGTQRGLALLAGFARAMILDADPNRADAAYNGLPSPFLIRNNSNLFLEVTNPGAAGTPWTGDLVIVAEGYKVFPSLPVQIPRTIEAYSVPFSLNTNFVVAQPAAATGNLDNQIATITNNGEGTFLAKGFAVQFIDANGVDQTYNVLPTVGFNFTDTSSGTKEWVQNQTAGAGPTACPASILTMHGAYLAFNTPRFIDSNGVIQCRFVFPNVAGSLAYLAGLNWPMTVTLNFFGSLLPVGV